MQNRIHYITLSVAGVLSLTSPRVIMAGTPSAPVTVVNTSANPVPVVQQGTANVSVANTTANPVPVAQQGPVSLATGTSVKITADTPLQVTTHQPQLVRITVFCGPVNLGAGGQVWTVPQGKLLLIKHVNWLAYQFSGQTLAPIGEVTVSDAGLSNVRNYDFPVQQQGVNGDYLVFAGSFQALIVAEAGKQIFVRTESAPTYRLEAQLTGTLIDDDGSLIGVDVSF